MLQAHERLGDFEIIRLLGKGGMGEVYEARQSNPDRPVALKVLAPWLARDEEALQRFWREAKVPANLDHPGIVRIISTGTTDDGTAYYAMHLVRGVSLADMVKLATATPMPPAVTQPTVDYDTPSQAAPAGDDDVQPPASSPNSATFPPIYKEYVRDRFGAVARIGAQAARALAYAHQQGSLHRDIKPSNLMVDHHNQVYLVDFGLTRGLVDVDGNGTNPGVVPGTPWYMSPEQAEGKKLDGRTDIYSLGVTLYELATQGLGPFSVSRQNREAVLSHVRTGQLLPLRTLAHGIPPALERIILKAMHYLPRKRYATAEEFALDLEGYTQQSGDYPKRALPRGPAQLRRPWPVWVAGALAVAALIAAVAVALNWRARPDVDAGKKGSEIVVNPPKLDGTQALPETLRDRNNLNVAVRLLDNNGVPRWSERLYGTGKYAPVVDYFTLAAESMLALADPDRSHFEFAVELAHTGIGNEAGIFFGMPRRTLGSGVPSRFFIVKWENQAVAGDAFGRITVGTGTVIKGNELRFDVLKDWLKPLPPGKDTLALMEWDKRTGWPWLKVNVHGENVTVTVPRRPPLAFSLAELKGFDHEAHVDLTATGTVGVWSRQGVALFKNATVTPFE